MSNAHKLIAARNLGAVTKMVGLFVRKPADRRVMVAQLTKQGPPHKQALTGLLMAETYALVKATEKRTGRKFAPNAGVRITIAGEHEDDAYELPVTAIVRLPRALAADAAGIIADAPEHESLAYLMVLQAMRWTHDAG